jgi:hypothetical protein
MQIQINLAYLRVVTASHARAYLDVFLFIFSARLDDTFIQKV